MAGILSPQQVGAIDDLYSPILQYKLGHPNQYRKFTAFDDNGDIIQIDIYADVNLTERMYRKLITWDANHYLLSITVIRYPDLVTVTKNYSWDTIDEVPDLLKQEKAI